MELATLCGLIFHATNIFADKIAIANQRPPRADSLHFRYLNTKCALPLLGISRA
jgi:hypothetical protein